MSDKVFYEVQRPTQWWLKLVFAVICIGLTAAAIVAMVTKKTGLSGTIAIAAPAAVVLLFFKSLKLQVEIDADSINYRFLPFQLKYRTIKRADIKKMEVITYDPIRDYGGWGVRYSKKGWAYTVKGNHGLSIQLVTGKNLLIGTSEPEDLQRWIVHHFVPKTDTPR